MQRMNGYVRRFLTLAVLLGSSLAGSEPLSAQTGAWSTAAYSPAQGTDSVNTITGKLDTLPGNWSTTGHYYLIPVADLVGDSAYVLAEQDSNKNSGGNAGRRVVMEVRPYIYNRGNVIDGGFASWIELNGKGAVDTLRRCDTTDVFSFGLTNLAAGYVELRMRTTNADSAGILATTKYTITWQVQGRKLTQPVGQNLAGFAKGYSYRQSIGGNAKPIDTVLTFIDLSNVSGDSVRVLAQQDTGTAGARKLVFEVAPYIKGLGGIADDTLSGWTEIDTISGVTRYASPPIFKGAGTHLATRWRTTPNDTTGFGAATAPSASSLQIGVIHQTAR